MNDEEKKAEKDYNDWSRTENVNHIGGMNAPKINDEEIKLIKKTNPKKILDIGCGNGKRLFSYLEKHNIDYLGVEKFERLVNDDKYSKKIIVSDFLELDISNLKGIDTITILGGSLNGIFGIDKQKLFWDKIVEILPKSGKVIFDSLVLDGFDTRDEIGIVNLIPNIMPPQYFLSNKQLKNIFKNRNLEILNQSEIQIPGPHTLRYYLLEKKS